MNQKLIDLAVERGRLIERISNQRQLLDQQLQPVGQALDAVDRVVATVRKGADCVKRNPEVVIAGVAVLVIVQPRRIWRWSKRGFVLWRSWRLLQQQLSRYGLLKRP
ncbi:MAG: YqjK family protein [Candidatus Accumulibacter sp. UW26]|jgi:predicted GTPase